MVALRTGKSVRNVVMGVYRQDGVVAWIRVDSEPVAPQGADPIVVVTTFREIAEPRLTEELRALQSAIAPLPIGVVVGESPPGSRPRILAYNDQFRQMVGDLPAEGSEARGMTYRIFRADRQTELAPEDWPGCRAARLGEAVSDPELHVLRGDGSWRVLTVSAAPVKTGSDNQGYCAVEVALDITEHRPAQVDPGTHAGRRSACRRRGHGRSRSAP
jgi:PAS domain-containing protein